MVMTYQEDARERYAMTLAAMKPSENLNTWALYMTAKYGESVRLDHDCYQDWILALMIVMWGGDETKWPAGFTEKEEIRAASWYKGSAPQGVQYQKDGGFGQDMSTRLLS